MKLNNKIIQPLSLAVLVSMTSGAFADIPPLPSDFPPVPLAPDLPSSLPPVPSAPPVPTVKPGDTVPTTTIMFSGKIKGAPTWNNARARTRQTVRFSVKEGSKVLTNPSVVTSRTVSALDCNTAAAASTPTYQFRGTKVRYNRGLKSFVMEWTLPANAVRGQCLSLNIKAGSSASALVKVK